MLEGSALGLGEKRPGAMAEKKAGGEAGLVALLLAVGLAAGLVGGGSALGCRFSRAGGDGRGTCDSRETLVLRWQDGRLWVLDLVTATNAGSETLSEVRLPLAQGAAGVSVEGGELEVRRMVVGPRAGVAGRDPPVHAAVLRDPLFAGLIRCSGRSCTRRQSFS